jgi:hypothetical protein
MKVEILLGLSASPHFKITVDGHSTADLPYKIAPVIGPELELSIGLPYSNGSRTVNFDNVSLRVAP